MRVTVIFADSAVYVDGEARVVDLPPHDANLHAMQWDGERGDVEVRVGPGCVIADQSVIEPFVAAWHMAAPAPVAPPGQPAAGVEEM